jgi:hypothetical protein
MTARKRAKTQGRFCPHEQVEMKQTVDKEKNGEEKTHDT